MRYQNLTYIPEDTPKPEVPPEAVKMIDSEGRIYFQHPDKVARRIEQGWKVFEEPELKGVEAEDEPKKPVRKARAKKKSKAKDK
jgi:hypothetical protein